MSDGDGSGRVPVVQPQIPWYLYTLAAALVGGGSGYVIQGSDVTLSELSRDLGERDVRIEKMEAVMTAFELRCRQITERVIRIEVEMDEHNQILRREGKPKYRSGVSLDNVEVQACLDSVAGTVTAGG